MIFDLVTKILLDSLLGGFMWTLLEGLHTRNLQFLFFFLEYLSKCLTLDPGFKSEEVLSDYSSKSWIILDTVH